MASIAINGLGRIGRAALKILEQADGAEVVAVNDLIPPDNLAYLLRYDTVYGRWHRPVTSDGDALVVGGRKIPVLAERDPASLPWKALGVDLVLECTGAFRREDDLRKHLAAGARRVILSAPARTETVATVVYGVNQAPPEEQVVSCASCTTNCITPVAEVLGRRFGIRQAIMTTVHAYTSSGGRGRRGGRPCKRVRTAGPRGGDGGRGDDRPGDHRHRGHRRGGCPAPAGRAARPAGAGPQCGGRGRRPAAGRDRQPRRRGGPAHDRAGVPGVRPGRPWPPVPDRMRSTLPRPCPGLPPAPCRRIRRRSDPARRRRVPHVWRLRQRGTRAARSRAPGAGTNLSCEITWRRDDGPDSQATDGGSVGLAG